MPLSFDLMIGVAVFAYYVVQQKICVYNCVQYCTDYTIHM